MSALDSYLNEDSSSGQKQNALDSYLNEDGVSDQKALESIKSDKSESKEKEYNTFSTAIPEVGRRLMNAGKGLVQGADIVLSHVPNPPFMMGGDRTEDDIKKFQAANADNPQFNRAVPIGEALASAPLLMGGNALLGGLPKVGRFITGAGGSNFLTKGLSSVTGGAITGAGANSLINQDPTEGAVIAAALGPITRMISGNGSLTNIVENEALPSTSQEMHDIAANKFKESAEKGGQYSGEFNKKIEDLINSQKYTSKLGEAFGKDSQITSVANTFKGLKGSLGLDDLKDFDEILSGKISNEVRPNGTLTVDGNKLLNIQHKLRDMVINPKEGDLLLGSSSEGANLLGEARKAWSAYLKMRDLENIELRAESAAQPDTVLKNGYASLLKNSKKSNFYSNDEKALLQKAAKTGVAQDLTNLIGSRLTAYVSGALGGISGAAIGYGAGALARNISAASREEKGQAVKNLIAKNALPNVPIASVGGNNLLLPANVNRLVGLIPGLGAEALSSSQ